MQKSVEATRRELAGLRTGRAHPGLVEHIRVEYYGTPVPLNQLATITAPEPRLLVIQPWDRSALRNIEKALMQSDLGLHPTSDGNVLRVPIPPLTEERRQDLVRLARKLAEEGR
ncbi:MAG: ribosome-recycling factor, partial [Armatimonadota bacterium]|nr:ribosome-recycling factor [Armatimonadota bacterium]